MADLLIVDDEPHMTYLLAGKLRRAGHTTRVAGDGEEALLIATERVPDLILTDFQMPYIDGLALAQRLRELPDTAQTPVVMLTARGHKVSDDELARTNIKHLLPKPFSGNDVVKLVAELLDASKQQAA